QCRKRLGFRIGDTGVEEMRVQPLVKLVIPRDDGAGQTSDEQKHRREQSRPTMNNDECVAHSPPYQAGARVKTNLTRVIRFSRQRATQKRPSATVQQRKALSC